MITACPLCTRERLRSSLRYLRVKSFCSLGIRKLDHGVSLSYRYSNEEPHTHRKCKNTKYRSTTGSTTGTTGSTGTRYSVVRCCQEVKHPFGKCKMQAKVPVRTRMIDKNIYIPTYILCCQKKRIRCV
jgi:hypothetical protein